jgi:hypothetical protein
MKKLNIILPCPATSTLIIIPYLHQMGGLWFIDCVFKDKWNDTCPKNNSCFFDFEMEFSPQAAINKWNLAVKEYE